MIITLNRTEFSLYANDFTLFLHRNKRAQMVEHFLQKTLDISYKWSLVSGFSSSPLKSKYITFTRKRKLKHVKLYMNNIFINNENTVKVSS